MYRSIFNVKRFLIDIDELFKKEIAVFIYIDKFTIIHFFAWEQLAVEL